MDAYCQNHSNCHFGDEASVTSANSINERMTFHQEKEKNDSRQSR